MIDYDSDDDKEYINEFFNRKKKYSYITKREKCYNLRDVVKNLIDQSNNVDNNYKYDLLIKIYSNKPKDIKLGIFEYFVEYDKNIDELIRIVNQKFKQDVEPYDIVSYVYLKQHGG